MKIDISLRKQPTNGKNEPVYLRFNDYNSKLFKGNKRFWYKTDYTLKKGSDIKKLPIQARHILENWIIEIEKDFNNRVDFTSTNNWFQKVCSELINSKKRNGFLLKDFMFEHIEKKIKEGVSYNTIKDIKQNASIINAFKDNIELADCNSQFFESLVNYLRHDKKYAVSNLNRKIGFLKVVLRNAHKLHKTEVPTDYRDFEIVVETKKQQNIKSNIYKVTFTDSELDSINNLELTKESLINVRKWLNIGVNTALRGDDLLSLKIEDFNFEERIIRWQQGKTGSYALIPIVPPLLEIIKDFPRKISTQKLNDYLKELCRLGGMTQIIRAEKKVKTDVGIRKQIVEAEKYTFCSSHMFRRTFVTNWFGKLDNKEIMKVSGHQTEKEFLKYVQEVETNHQVWFDFFDKKK